MDSAKMTVDYIALREELEDLLCNKRKEVANKLRDARALGDLADNPAYDEACDERRALEKRIDEIKELLLKEQP